MSLQSSPVCLPNARHRLTGGHRPLQLNERGKLAAARTAGEQALVLQLAGTSAVWTAGFSPSASCAATASCIWRWEGYSTSVNFNQAYIRDSIGSTDWSSRSQQVLLNNYIDSQAWAYQAPNDAAASHAFVCRKDACAPGESVSELLVCATDPTAAGGAAYAWVAGAVIGGVVCLLAVAMLVLWKVDNARFHALVARLACAGCHRPTTTLKRRIRELEDENERLRGQLRRGSDPAAGLGLNSLLPALGGAQAGAVGVAGLPTIKPKRASGSPKSSPALGGHNKPTSLPRFPGGPNRIGPAGGDSVV